MQREHAEGQSPPALRPTLRLPIAVLCGLWLVGCGSPSSGGTQGGSYIPPPVFGADVASGIKDAAVSKDSSSVQDGESSGIEDIAPVTDATADAKADAKTDTKSDGSGDTKTDTKTDAKTDTKSDVKADTADIQGEVCGDGSCVAPEDCNSCANDCGPCGPSCGNGQCESGETCSTCAQDCGPCPCGDGVCDPTKDESCNTCPADCTCPSGCGNGICDQSKENCQKCQADCGKCPAPAAGKVCNAVSSAGCLSVEQCYVTSDGKSTVCSAPGSVPKGEACVALADCVAGTLCLAGLCRPVCDSSGKLPGFGCAPLATCVQLKSDTVTYPDNVGVCVGGDSCALVTSAGCPSGLSCDLYNATSKACLPAGNGGNGATCQDNGECLATHICVGSGAAGTCAQRCDAVSKLPKCPVGKTCKPLSYGDPPKSMPENLGACL